MINNYHLSIIGFGASGLFALEQFYLGLSEKSLNQFPKCVVFEPHHNLGTGKAWNLEQTDSNWSNISDRALQVFPERPQIEINGITIPRFPGHFEWLKKVLNHKYSEKKDAFFPRRIMGMYLSQRALSITKRLQSLELLDIIQQNVIAVKNEVNVYILETDKKEIFNSQHVLLALGHLKTKISSQNKRFKTHADKHDLYFSNHSYSKEAQDIYKKSKVIAIKGLGLSMIDVVRMILENYKGKFVKRNNSIFLDFVSDLKGLQIVPFSLDGLPMVPKPIGKIVDNHFTVESQRKEKLLQILRDQVEQGSIKSIEDILYPIAGEISLVYKKLDNYISDSSFTVEDLTVVIVSWLIDPSLQHNHILDTNLPIVDYMKETCEMAYAIKPFSLDYVIGQTWRQLHPDLYNIYSHKIDRDLMAALIQVNEKIKRYSYGPPVESVLQLIVLQEAGILNLEFVNNPDIKLVKDGFAIKNKQSKIICAAMIDAIVADPNLVDIEHPIIDCLKAQNLVEQVSKELGIIVDADTTHLVNGIKKEGLYSIGRNTKGSIFGVDAILECFNVQKLSDWKTQILKDF